MHDGVIDRSREVVDRSNYIRLVNLHQRYEWTLRKPDALFELWCLTDNDSQKNLIQFLIEKFFHVDGKKLDEGCDVIANHVESIWGLTAQNTYLSAVCDNSKPDGSQMLIQGAKNRFSPNWRECNFYNSLPVAANEIKDNSNIVLIDDFIGTGDTICRKVKYLRQVIEKRKLSNISIYIASLVAMRF